MHSSHYGGIEKSRGDIISGYYRYDNGEVINTKALYENIGVADAPLVSSVEDIALLLKTIVGENSFISQQVKETLFGENTLQYTEEGNYYGQGIFKETFNGTVIFHHGGEESGYSTTNIYIPSSDISITAFFNCGDFTLCSTKTDALIKRVLQNELK